MVSQDVDTLKPPPSMASAVALTVPGSKSPSISMPSLPAQPASSPSPGLASSSTSLASRSISPHDERGNITSRTSSAKPARPPSFEIEPQKQDDVKPLILQSLVPHIAVHVSADTDQLAQDKGFNGGFWDLLRPLGEQVHGKVTIRDSVGASRSWEDLGVRFIRLGDNLGSRYYVERRPAEVRVKEMNGTLGEARSAHPADASPLRFGGDIGQIEELVDRHLSYAESVSDAPNPAPLNPSQPEKTLAGLASPFYALFLRRLLSGIPLSPHETFSHPVACIIAISSRNAAPIEALRQLYDQTSRGDKRLPQWINGDYLRYYVLVHDEETDQIAQSTALFEQMKRHFGLHCHLLRLRGSQCIPTDDDSVRVPICQWVSAAEDLARINQEGT